MSSEVEQKTVDLGEIIPARSRHAGRRSAVTLADSVVVTGTATGSVLAHDRTTLDERWRAEKDLETSVVSAESFGEGVVVGERSVLGGIQCFDGHGERQWRYDTADDVGDPTKETRFFLPFVVDIETDGEHAYVASRRYERDGDVRSFTSVVYAFEADGTVAWTYETDASPISLDARDHRVAVAYNRCPGVHQHGLVILETDTGTEQYRWDPGTDGQRRIGDASLVESGVVVASHGDYRGYRLGADGAKQWSVDLARPTEIDGETLYAYPNHVHATADGTIFVTGNTYSTDGRETDSLHPDEHTIAGYTPEGKRAWSVSVGGFAGEIGVDGESVAVPSAQQFRARDPGVHGLHVFDICDGHHRSVDTEGIVTAVGREKNTIVAVEEPVVYHDEGTTHGAYRLHRLSL